MTNQTELIPTMPGDILRHHRETKGYTLEQTAQLSKIKLDVLSAIESGETDEIPSVYLRGYIRNYARFLGLDSEKLDQHMQHVKFADPALRSVFYARPRRSSTDRWLKATSYFAASALIATLAWQFTHEAVRFSQGDSALTTGTAVPEQVSAETEVPDYPARKHLSASIASMEMLGQLDEQEGEAHSQQAITATEAPGDMPAHPIGDQAAGGSGTLQVATSADTWVEILDADGVQLEMDLIRADESRNYEGNAPYSILVGRASAVRIMFDGQPVDLAPHTRGNVARVTLGSQMTASSEEQTDGHQR
jgi:cytoskeleton protein RodZ